MSVDSEKKTFSDKETKVTTQDAKIRRLGNSRTRKTVLRKHGPNRTEEFFRSC